MAYRNGLLAGLLEAELLGRKSTYAPTSFTQAFTCQAKHAGIIRVDPDGDPCPPYSITYNKVANGCRFLTVGDEEGCVSIVDTNADTLPSSLYTDQERQPRAKWLAHNNTIFDVAWAKNDSVLYTASGDQQVGVWDTAVGRLRVFCAGHDGSVKAVCPHSTQPDIFASGSRDGGILLWDLRMPSQWHAGRNRMQLGPVKRIDIAASPGQQCGQQQQQQHTPGSAGRHPGRAAGSGRGPAAPAAAHCRRSVTSLLFVRNEHTMFSSSDMDGVVKLWDLRKLTTPTGDITLPAGSDSPAPGRAHCRGAAGRGRVAGGRRAAAAAAGDSDVCWLGFTCLSRSSRPAGITSMAVAPEGDMLLVSSIDSKLYLYRLSALDQPPVAVFSGHRTDSFCIKACFSPCGRHILSGSSDRRAYIWDVSQPSLPPVSLAGHAGEVTAVAWCPTDQCQIATAGDDATVRVWAMDRSNTKYQQVYDHCNYLFTEAGQQQGLWNRWGCGGTGTPAAAAAAQGGQDRDSFYVQDQQQHEIAPAPAAGKLHQPPPAAAVSAATAGGMAVAGQAPSMCSPPVTPQLPCWRKESIPVVGSTPGGGRAAAAAAVACQTPISQQQHKALPGSSKPRHTTPRLRQLLLSEQLSSVTRDRKQQAAPAQQPAAAAAAAGQAPGHRAAKAGQVHKQQQQQQQQQSDPQCDVMEPQPQLDSAAAAPETMKPNIHAAKSPAASAAVPRNAASHADGVQAFEDWMRGLTPSQPDDPSSQQGNSQQQQQQCAGPAGSLYVPGCQRGEQPSTVRRGGIVELSTPWALPTPLRQQRLAEQAVLEAARVQQRQRLQGLSPQEQQQQQQGCKEWENLPRQLQDEFEVFCDDGSQPQGGAAAAAADSAGTPGSFCPQENMFRAYLQEAAEAVGQGGTADACTSDRAMVVDTDMVPCSLHADVPAGEQMHDPLAATQQPVQQQQQLLAWQGQSLQVLRSAERRQQQQQQQLPVDRCASLLQVAGQKPGEAQEGWTGRTPLGDISTLLPVTTAGPLSPGGIAAAAAVLGGRVRDLADSSVNNRNSPVRALHVALGGAGASAAAAAVAAGPADSPLLLMLQHAQLTTQQQQQGVTGPLGKSPQQQQQQLVSPVRHSPAYCGEGHKRLSRLGERQVTPMTFYAGHQPQQHRLQPEEHRQQQLYGSVDQCSVPAVHAGVAAMLQHHHQQQQVDKGAEKQTGAGASLSSGVEEHERQIAALVAFFHEVDCEEFKAEHDPSGALQEGGAEAELVPAAARAVAAGGIKRSAAPPPSTHKRQCTLADLWRAKPPEVEDLESRFSAF